MRWSGGRSEWGWEGGGHSSEYGRERVKFCRERREDLFSEILKAS